MDRLFVYGSLKAGGSAHHLLIGALAEARGALDQVDLIGFAGDPMLRAGSTQVEGEVYWIPDSLWPELDAWEEGPRGLPTLPPGAHRRKGRLGLRGLLNQH